MKPHDLEINEQELLESYERDEWQSIPRLEAELQQYRAYATAQLGGSRLVSVGISPEDFERIQQKAQEKGVPHEKFIANIVHQFVSGRLIEQT